MQVKDILSAITTYREERGWTEYQLAECSGLPQSTISSWYRKNMVPTIPSLEKICKAFGITLSQLFAEEDSPVSLTDSQRKLLERWSRLSEEQQAVVFALLINRNLTVEPPLRFAGILPDRHSKSILHRTADRCR